MKSWGLLKVLTRPCIFQRILFHHIPVLSHAPHEEVEGFALISASSSACPQLTVFHKPCRTWSILESIWEFWGRLGVVIVFPSFVHSLQGHALTLPL